MGTRITNRRKSGWLLMAVLSFCIMMGIASIIPANVFAADIQTPYLAEQAIGKAPDVKVYVTGSKMNTSLSVSGKIDDISFNQNGDIETFRNSGEGLEYIFLIDNSGSVNEKQLNEATDQLATLRKNLKEEDALSIYTVGTKSKTGEKNNVIGRTALGSETDSLASDVKKIKGIKKMGADSQTVLYRSINQILASMDTPQKRTVLVIITDGEDDSEGKDMNKTNTLDEVKSGIIPVYGILLNTTRQKPDTKKIIYTKDKIFAEKNSRGFYYDCSEKGSAKLVKKAFKKLDEIFKDQTYIVKLKAKTNKTVGTTTLKLQIGDKSDATVKFNYSDSVKDEVAPSIEGEAEVSGKKNITLRIVDEYGVNSTDANDKTNYTLSYQGKSKKDKKTENFSIAEVKAEKSGNGVDVTIETKEDLYKGNYTLQVKGISDNSAQANKMDQTIELMAKDGVNPTMAKFKRFLKSYWWIFVILLILIIGAIVIVIAKKKSVKIVEINPDELNKAETKLIRMTITDRAGMIKNLEWTVEGSLFVGRSNINNIFFDDDRLSKQHFVIEVTKLGCYIQDLDSTNGTFVNGVRISQKRLLLDGDIVTAGREKFEYHMPKNDIIDEEE